MKNKNLHLTFLVVALLVTSCFEKAYSQNVATKKKLKETSELYKTIFHMDSVLFNAFNNRDMEKFKTLFTEDLEFYHDKDGLTGYIQTIESFKSLAAKNNGLRRDLIAGSLEVYPLKDFGAMQIGTHRFCHTENNKPDCGSFKFVHIWKQINGEWKISRVVSYGH